MNTVMSTQEMSTVEFSYNWVPVRASDKKDAPPAESSPPPASVAVTVSRPSPGGEQQSFVEGSRISRSHTAEESSRHDAVEDAYDRPPPAGVCFTYYYNGCCDRAGCPYRHTLPSQSKSQVSDESQSYRQGSRPSQRDEADDDRSQQRAEYSTSSSRRSPYRSTTTRYDNHNYDPEYFGADRTYRPKGFQQHRPCFAFQRGYCKFGSQCAFSHDMEECAEQR
jgi:hypothetical protein